MKQLKIFLTKIRPTLPLTDAPLVRPKGLTKGRGDWFHQYFPPKSYYIWHQQFSIPTSCTHILLSFSTYILFFTHTLTHNSHLFFSFGRIIIDIIVHGRKRKTCINVLLSFSIHILSFAHTLIHNLCHFFFWKDNNWHHCLYKEKKDVYYF